MVERKFGTPERKQMASKGTAMPDGSFPIPDKDALRRAVQSFGRAPAEKKAAVKVHILKRARALGAMDVIPDDWTKAAASRVLINKVADRINIMRLDAASAKSQPRSKQGKFESTGGAGGGAGGGSSDEAKFEGALAKLHDEDSEPNYVPADSLKSGDIIAQENWDVSTTEIIEVQSKKKASFDPKNPDHVSAFDNIPDAGAPGWEIKGKNLDPTYGGSVTTFLERGTTITKLN